jgi:hypothetical protein
MPDALEHTLTPRQQARLAAHVEECPECGPMLRGLIRLRSALRTMGAETLIEDTSIVPAVLERLHSETVAGAQVATRRRWGRA